MVIPVERYTTKTAQNNITAQFTNWFTFETEYGYFPLKLAELYLPQAINPKIG